MIKPIFLEAGSFIISKLNLADFNIHHTGSFPISVPLYHFISTMNSRP